MVQIGQLPDLDILGSVDTKVLLDSIPEPELDEIPELNLEAIELQEINLADIPEPDLDSIDLDVTRELNGLLEKQDREIEKLLGLPGPRKARKGSGRQRRAGKANTPNK